jgi:hypothetical protein
LKIEEEWTHNARAQRRIESLDLHIARARIRLLRLQMPSLPSVLRMELALLTSCTFCFRLLHRQGNTTSSLIAFISTLQRVQDTRKRRTSRGMAALAAQALEYHRAPFHCRLLCVFLLRTACILLSFGFHSFRWRLAVDNERQRARATGAIITLSEGPRTAIQDFAIIRCFYLTSSTGQLR